MFSCRLAKGSRYSCAQPAITSCSFMSTWLRRSLYNLSSTDNKKAHQVCASLLQWDKQDITGNKRCKIQILIRVPAKDADEDQGLDWQVNLWRQSTDTVGLSNTTSWSSSKCVPGQPTTPASLWRDTTREGTYCSFKSVNCFSRVVISSRHSILLLSQSSSSISVRINTGQTWHPLHCVSSQTSGAASPPLQNVSTCPAKKYLLTFNNNHKPHWPHV